MNACYFLWFQVPERDETNTNACDASHGGRGPMSPLPFTKKRHRLLLVINKTVSLKDICFTQIYSLVKYTTKSSLVMDVLVFSRLSMSDKCMSMNVNSTLMP